jgi:RNA polymerase II C-terminal domain phosphatase-like 3/4
MPRRYDMKEVYMTSLEAARRDKHNFVKAVKLRKLALVLDLDETILHSMSGRAEDTPTMRAVARRLKDEGHPFSSEILIGEFITKLRPGAREFLARANEKFSIYVHTKGKKGYKQWLMSEIDPSRKIFPPGVVDRLASYQDVCVFSYVTTAFLN